MIVVGVDVHKQSLTAVAVDEVGRPVAELTASSGEELLAWSASLGLERLWALEDCRQLTRQLERTLIEAGEQLVRVPPKLMAPSRRAGRVRGKSDPIDALAVARAALREPNLSRPRPDEQPFRELKRLVDHREDLVDERRRIQQRLRWHLHQLDPSFLVPLRRLDRPLHLDRVGRWLARREQDVQVRVARELVTRCRSLTRTSWSSTVNSSSGPKRSRPPCSSCPAALRSPPQSCWPRSARSVASKPTPSSPATAASHPWKPAQGACNATDSTAAATANSTLPSTGSQSPKPATTPPHAPTSNANKPKAKAAAKPSAASNDNSHASSSTP